MVNGNSNDVRYQDESVREPFVQLQKRNITLQLDNALVRIVITFSGNITLLFLETSPLLNMRSDEMERSLRQDQNQTVTQAKVRQSFNILKNNPKAVLKPLPRLYQCKRNLPIYWHCKLSWSTTSLSQHVALSLVTRNGLCQMHLLWTFLRRMNKYFVDILIA